MYVHISKEIYLQKISNMNIQLNICMKEGKERRKMRNLLFFYSSEAISQKKKSPK